MKAIQTIATLVILILMAAGAAAQIPPDIGENTGASSPCPQGAEQVKITPSVICLEYNKRDVLVGRSDIPLKITINSPAESPLKLVRLSVSDENLGKPITFEILGSDETPSPEGELIQTSYSARLSVSEEAEPRIYPISLGLKYENKETLPEDKIFRLRVGAGGDGGIEIIDKSKSVTCMTGSTKELPVELKSTLRDNPIRLHNVKVYSDPSGLVAEKSIVIDVPIRTRKETGRLTVPVEVRSWQLIDLIYGFEDAALKLDLVYEDADGRQLTDTESLKLNIRPSVFVLSGAILIGVLAGTVVKIDLRRLQEEGYITRKQKAYFIAGTVVVGLIVAMVALFGEVKISAFTFSGSYDSPKVLFLIGFAATMVGPPLLQGIFKSPKRQERGSNERGT